MKWTDVWKPPFKYDHYGYVWDADNVMTFTVDDLTKKNDGWMQEFCDNLVNALNGDDCRKYPDLHIDECDLYRGEELIGYFRGWGHLCGGLRLSADKAAAVQDEMIRFVMEKISE